MRVPSTRLFGGLIFARLLIAALILPVPAECLAQKDAAERWLERFEFAQPRAASEGICTGTIGALPRFVVWPTSVGEQLVRVSLPFAPGALPEEMGLQVALGEQTFQADLRPLTWHPGKPRSVRRGMVTFTWPSNTRAPRTSQLKLAPPPQPSGTQLCQDGDHWSLAFQGLTLRLNPTEVRVTHRDGPVWRVRLIGPPLALDAAQIAAPSQTARRRMT